MRLKIAERGCEVCGIDISEDAIKHAKRLAEREGITYEFVVGNAEDLSYPDGYFNKVVFSFSLEYIEDDVRALKEVGRVLKNEWKTCSNRPSLTYFINDKIKEKHRKIAYVINYYTDERMKKIQDDGI